MVRFFSVLIILFTSFFAVSAENIISGYISSGYLHNLWSEENLIQQKPLKIYLQTDIDADCIQIESYWQKCTFRAINANEFQFTQFTEIDTNIYIGVNIAYAQHKKLAEISFSPFRRNANGEIEVVDSFEIGLKPIYKPQQRVLLKASNKTNSLLNEGNWFKIKVDTSGVYKLTFDELKTLGLTNPANTRIFSYGGKQLSFINNNEDFDDLNEIPISKNLGTDGVFNSGDYLIFYAQGPTILIRDTLNNILLHQKHDYSDYIYLLLTSDLGAGAEIQNYTNNSSNIDITTSESDSYQYIEKDKYSLIPSGRRWFDNRLTTNATDSIMFNFGELVAGEPVNCYVAAAGRKDTNTSASFQFSYRKEIIASISISKSYDNYRYADYVQKNFKLTPQSAKINLGYSYVSNSARSEGYIDKIGLTARTKLKYNKSRQLHFRDLKSKNYINVRYNLAVTSGAPTIWDITNPLSPKNIDIQTDNNQINFTVASNGTAHEFVAFEQSNLRSPITTGNDVGRIENQNLHGQPTPTLVIVTHPNFIDAANNLAEMHRTQDEMRVEVVTEQQIFNEFSGGTPDVSAIRNYARMLYRRNDGFKYLLLFGDGSYDNKNILGTNSNFILTYQSENGEDDSRSYVSDDFFAMLDNGEGELNGYLDIGVGRLPAKSATEAGQMVDKIKRYTSMKDVGNWRNNITIIADDADKQEDASFILNAEQLSKTIEQTTPEYNISKIYYDAYESVSSSSGDTYPAVNEAIKKQFNKGTVMLTYIGHGSARKWSHESVFLAADATSLRNINRLPLVITASCENGRFDEHTITSLGESFILNAHGGAIAALVTTRVVYDGNNCQLCNNIYNQKPDNDLRLGDLILRAKNATGGRTETNKRNFTLLGDPAIRLVHPANNKIVVTKINHKDVSTQLSDTINAVDMVTIEGYLTDQDGNLLNDNGILYSTIFDKASAQTTRGNDEFAPIIDFYTYNNILYSGKSSITDGYFTLQFIMPKDINYSYGQGRISLYALTNTGDEATGYSNNLLIGGTPENTTIDDFDGPEIELFVNDTFFVDGGITSNNPTIIARIFDESGINTTGNGIGHNITATLDEDASTMLILNDLYEGNIDKFNSGEIKFNLNNLSEGWHTLTLKVWDIYNNSSDATISFKVVDETSTALNRVYCYPNPATNEVWFVADHNQTDYNIDITIKIFDNAGTMVGKLTTTQETHQPIHWNTTHNGKPLENGLYIYTIEIKSTNGRSTKSGKMIIAKQ